MKKYKGVIMAGGSGSRLWPLTQSSSKQLMPVFDKPMIYYPLALLMEAGIKDFAIVVNQTDLDNFENLLGDGRQWGISICYLIQQRPDGIGKAPILAEAFLDGAPFVMALGDNLIHGKDVAFNLRQAMQSNQGATLFSKSVADPQAFGVVCYGADGQITNIEEKPTHPQSTQAVTGLYIFDRRASSWAPWLRPSPRGEVEITDLLKLYLKNSALRGEKLDESVTWLDTGTQSALLNASKFVCEHQKRFNKMVGSPEATAFLKRWIDFPSFVRLALAQQKSEYGALLLNQISSYTPDQHMLSC